MSAAEHPTERALSFARLPDRIDGWRVLVVGAEDPGRDYLNSLGAGEFVSLAAPVENAELETASFDLAIYGSEVETDAHPLAVFAWLKRTLKPEGVLIAGWDVLTDPAKSQYARFIPADRDNQASRWLPGRLAFRWMVEVSGFDVVDWLGPEGERNKIGNTAYLQAHSAEREPALDLDRQPLPARN